MGPGVADPAEVVAGGEQGHGQRVGAPSGVGGDAAGPVEREVEPDLGAPLPVDRVAHVVGGHPDHRRRRDVGWAVGTGRAVATGDPPDIGQQDVIDVHREIAAVQSEVHAAGEPADQARGQHLQLRRAHVVAEGQHQFLPAAAGQDTGQRAVPLAVRPGGGQLRLEAGERPGQLHPGVAGFGVLVGERDRSAGVAEIGADGLGAELGDAVERATVAERVARPPRRRRPGRRRRHRAGAP